MEQPEPEQLTFWPRRKRFTDRMELRLDDERRRRLSQIAEARGVTSSEVVRELIDEAYEHSLEQNGRIGVAGDS